MSTSNNNFSFFPAGIFSRRDFWRENPRRDFLKHLFQGLKSSLGSLLPSVWHIWVCFKYILTFWYSPWGKIPAGIFPRRNFSPQGFFPMGIFSAWQIQLFCIYSHLYCVWYGSSSVTACCSEFGWFCCFTSHVNSYGHCRTVSSPDHTFSWAGLNKRLTSNLCTYFRF